jgi:hypothetical protein
MSGFTLCSLVQSWKTRPYPSLGLRSRDLLWSAADFRLWQILLQKSKIERP